MNESYRIGAVFSIENLVSPEIGKMAKQLLDVESQIKGLKEAFDTLKLPKSLNEALAGTQAGFDRLAETSKIAGDSMARNFGISFDKIDETSKLAFNGLTNGFGRLDKSVNASIDRISALRLEMESLKLPATAVHTSGSHPRPGNTHGSAHGGGVDGLMMFLGADVGLHGLQDVLKLGGGLNDAAVQLKQAGISAAEFPKIMAAARYESEKWGFSIVSNLDTIKESRFAFGHLDEALTNLDQLNRLRVIENAAKAGKGDEDTGDLFKAVKSGELRGFNSAADYGVFFEDQAKIFNATGGKVGPGEVMTAIRAAKSAAMGWDEEFTARVLPTLIQNMGAPTAGQSLMTFNSSLVGDHMDAASVENLSKMGFIDPSKVSSKGKLTPGAVEDQAGLIANPDAWIQKYMAPYITSHYDLASEAGKSGAISFLTQSIGNRNAAAFAVEDIVRHPSIVKDAELQRSARGLASAEDIEKHDYSTATSRFEASWNNLLATLGGPAVDTAIGGMTKLSNAVNSISNTLAEHPNLAKTVDGTIAAGTVALGIGALGAAGKWLAGGFDWLKGSGKAVAEGAAGAAETVAPAAGRLLPSMGDFGTLGLLAWWSSIRDVGTKGLTDQQLRANPLGIILPGDAFHPADDDRQTRARALPAGEGYLMGSGFQPMSYKTNLDGSPLGGSSGGVSDATQALEDVIYKGMLHALVDFGQKGSVDGLTAASYGGSGLGGGGGGGGGGSGARNMRYGAGGHSPGVNLAGGDATGEHADFIRATAAKYGIDPRAAVAVAASEGLHASFAGGDKGTSFGDFQMHFGGSGIPGMNGMGLGDAFNKETGLDAKDPANWKVVDEWALKYASKHGWGDWHGAAHIGLHGMMGIGGNPIGGANLAGGDTHGTPGAGGKAAGINPMLNAMIDRASVILGTHLGIVSGLRSEAENIATGGAQNSLHMKGWAADLTAEGHGKGDAAWWRKVNGAMDQAGAEMGQPHRWGGTFGGRYARDNNHFDLTQGGPVGNLPANVTAFHPNAPTAAAPGSAAAEPQVHNHMVTVKLDGKAVGKAAYKHFAYTGRFPNAMGGPDHHSHYTSPGTPVTDAA